MKKITLLCIVIGLVLIPAGTLLGDSPPVDVRTLCERSSVVLRGEAVKLSDIVRVSATVGYRIATFRVKQVLKGREDALSTMRFVPLDASTTLEGKFLNVITIVATNTSDILPPKYVTGEEYALFLDYTASCLYARVPLDEYRREHRWTPEIAAQIEAALKR